MARFVVVAAVALAADSKELAESALNDLIALMGDRADEIDGVQGIAARDVPEDANDGFETSMVWDAVQGAVDDLDGGE